MQNRQFSDQLNETRARSAQYEGTLEPGRRKALGQFFTGLPLGRLLAAIAYESNFRTAIDPMAGHGDLLDAVAERAVRNNLHLNHLHGVEIDPPIAEIARVRMEAWFDQIDETAIHIGDAFDPCTSRLYLPHGYDLVIANPPYVRYQTLALQNGNVPQLSPDKIRRHLAEIVGGRVPPEEWRIWRTIIEKYSGLADLSVPAWILCASLVRPGGVLALVAPATWRSRNYGAVIEYLLASFFELQYLIEDTQPGWFSNVLVRTQLVIARRLPVALAESEYRPPVLTIKVSPSASGNGSLVGASFPIADPEGGFAAWIREGAPGKVMGLTAQQTPDFLETTARGRRHWIGTRETNEGAGPLFENDCKSPANLLPAAMRSLFDGITSSNLVLPEDIGLSISQGLRTGCNGFFYVDQIEEAGDTELVRLSPLFGKAELRVPANCLKPVLRGQSELTGPIDATQIKGRVLDLNGWVLPEDAEVVRGAKHLYERENIPVPEILPREMADFIRRAADTVYSGGQQPKRISELSAVRTNVRLPGADRSPRFWYMLPPFARRHRPDVFVPRVNQNIPWVEMNDDPPVLIDANFSTIWGEKSHWTRFALRALLNSVWCEACMEMLGTPLGGGALKLEAAQLRRMPLPRLDANELSSLDAAGQGLSLTATSVPESVNRFVLAKITGLHQSDSKLIKLLKGLELMSESLCRERQRKGA